MFQELTEKKKKKNRFANMSAIDLPSHESIYMFVIKMDTEAWIRPHCIFLQSIFQNN